MSHAACDEEWSRRRRRFERHVARPTSSEHVGHADATQLDALDTSSDARALSKDVRAKARPVRVCARHWLLAAKDGVGKEAIAARRARERARVEGLAVARRTLHDDGA